MHTGAGERNHELVWVERRASWSDGPRPPRLWRDVAKKNCCSLLRKVVGSRVTRFRFFLAAQRCNFGRLSSFLNRGFTSQPLRCKLTSCDFPPFVLAAQTWWIWIENYVVFLPLNQKKAMLNIQKKAMLNIVFWDVMMGVEVHRLWTTKSYKLSIVMKGKIRSYAQGDENLFFISTGLPSFCLKFFSWKGIFGRETSLKLEKMIDFLAAHHLLVN